MILAGETEVPVPMPVSTTNSTCTSVGSHRDLRGHLLAANGLGHGSPGLSVIVSHSVTLVFCSSHHNSCEKLTFTGRRYVTTCTVSFYTIVTVHSVLT